MTQLIALAGPSGAWRRSIIDKAIMLVPQSRSTALRRIFSFLTYRWSAKFGSYPAGDPALQLYVGDLLYKGRAAYPYGDYMLTNTRVVRGELRWRRTSPSFFGHA